MTPDPFSCPRPFFLSDPFSCPLSFFLSPTLFLVLTGVLARMASMPVSQLDKLLPDRW